MSEDFVPCCSCNININYYYGYNRYSYISEHLHYLATHAIAWHKKQPKDFLKKNIWNEPFSAAAWSYDAADAKTGPDKASRNPGLSGLHGTAGVASAGIQP